MEAGIAQEDTIFDCSGSIQVGGTVVRCSTGGKTGHGEITLREALENSCNCAFIELGIKTGGERILDMAEKMGLGRDVCPQISEVTGNLPSDAAECGIANLSIGQGTLLVTPLQITAMMRGIAGGGVFSQLRVLTGDTQKDLEKYGVMPEGVLRETKTTAGKQAYSVEEYGVFTVIDDGRCDRSRYCGRNTEIYRCGGGRKDGISPEQYVGKKCGSRLVQRFLSPE